MLKDFYYAFLLQPYARPAVELKGWPHGYVGVHQTVRNVYGDRTFDQVRRLQATLSVVELLSGIVPARVRALRLVRDELLYRGIT